MYSCRTPARIFPCPCRAMGKSAPCHAAQQGYPSHGMPCRLLLTRPLMQCHAMPCQVQTSSMACHTMPNILVRTGSYDAMPTLQTRLADPCDATKNGPCQGMAPASYAMSPHAASPHWHAYPCLLMPTNACPCRSMLLPCRRHAAAIPHRAMPY